MSGLACGPKPDCPPPRILQHAVVELGCHARAQIAQVRASIMETLWNNGAFIHSRAARSIPGKAWTGIYNRTDGGLSSRMEEGYQTDRKDQQCPCIRALDFAQLGSTPNDLRTLDFCRSPEDRRIFWSSIVCGDRRRTERVPGLTSVKWETPGIHYWLGQLLSV